MPVSVPIESRRIRTGPGTILFAPLGTAVPAMTVAQGVFTDLWPAGWLPVGPTDSGMSENHTIDTDNVTVEESLYPIRTETTGKTTTVAFTMADWKLDNIQLVLNGANITQVGAGADMLTKFSPPLIGAEVRVMLGWESSEGDERLIAYQAFQTGAFAPEYRKGSAKRVLAASFAVELPPAGVSTTPWDRWFAGQSAS